jgi:feruloyl-CoA synthase
MWSPGCPSLRLGWVRVLGALDFGDAEIVVSDRPPPGGGATRFEDLRSARPSSDLERALAALGPDSVAKILFTSGSTVAPKG